MRSQFIVYRHVGLLLAVTLIAACGDRTEQPTKPSSITPLGSTSSVGATASSASASALLSGGADVALTQAVFFPPRNEPYDFRLQLEGKYRDGLRRTPSASFVDIEGDIVWTQEYLRYRVNRCTHSEAIQRVMFQVDGGGVLPPCGEAPAGQVLFPPRNEPYDFRLQLETKYRDSLQRTAGQTHVDLEGDIVWTQEYLRYRVNGCDHYEAAQRVFAQIDGRGVQPVCVVIPPTPPGGGGGASGCGGGGTFSYCVSPVTRTVSASGGTYSISVTSNANWTATSTASWVTAFSTGLRFGNETVTYSVAANTSSGARTASILVEGASRLYPPAVHEIYQPSGSGAPFQYFVSPEQRSVSANGGTFSISITTSPPDASWTASTSQPSWLSIVSGGSGNGARVLTYTVSANPFGFERIGQVTVVGLSGQYPPGIHTVTQAPR